MQLHYPPQYVLDQMEMIEAKVAIQYGYYANKESWEQARFVALTSIKPHIKGNPQVEFYWEKEKSGNETIDKSDLKRLRIKAQQYLKTMNNG